MITGIYASIGVGSFSFTFHIRLGIVMDIRYCIVYNCIYYALRSCHFCGHVYVPKTLLCIVKVFVPCDRAIQCPCRQMLRSSHEKPRTPRLMLRTGGMYPATLMLLSLLKRSFPCPIPWRASSMQTRTDSLLRFSTLLRAESPLENLFRPKVEKRIQRC